MDYNEILCQAIDTIVGKRIAEVSYDQTIICTIIDDSKKAGGQYKVQSNDKFKFDAYCENTTYKNGYQVNVLVPNGDYSLKKTILGRYTANNDTDPVAYVSPLEKIVPMTDNLVNLATDRVQTPVGLTANGDQEVWPLFTAEVLGNIPYDTLCVKADFKCMLQNYLIRSGNYGLRLIITTEKEVVDISLDSAKDMFGNPYGFITYFTQQQTYHLNLTGPIKGIAGYFYQRGNFTYYDDTEEFDPLVPVNNAPNIFIDNIEVYFGYDVSQIEDNTVQIYSYESENYTSDGDLNKNLNLIWYNKTEDDKYLGFTDGIFNAEKAKSEPDPEDTNIYYCIEWYRDNNDGTWPLVVENGDESATSIIGVCHDLYGKTSFKARVYCNGNYYESSIITFINQTLSNADSINSLNLALLLHHGEHSEEAYPYYGGDNNLINISDAGRQRSLWFSYESTIGAILEPSVLEGAKVFWYISNVATMLTAGRNSSLFKVEEGSELESYILPGFDCYTKVLAVDTETGPSQQEKTFNYQIQRVFNATNVNNIIKLKIVDKNGHEYLAEKRFIFATSGTCGTDYSLVISEVDGQLAYSGGDYTLTAKLYDGDFQDVTPEGGITVKYTKPSSARDYEIATASTRVEWADNEIIVDAEYPVAWSSNAQYYYQGPTNIIYDSSGVNPVYYNGELAIFNQDNTKVEATWEMYYSQNGKQITDEAIIRYLPIIHFNESKKCYYVKAPNMFMNDINVDITLIALQGDTAIWGQPLLMYQNQYASSLLNNWGGELKIDEENNYILSAMIGAGKKNDNNTFSGVLMGEVGAKTEDATMGTIGLYGVHEGAQSFGLKIDGTMFLGKSGRGQITFDGNHGFIYSGNWITSFEGASPFNIEYINGVKNITLKEGKDGMAIDLQNGHIDAYNFKLTSAGLQLNSNPQTGEYYLNAGDENNYIRFGDKLEIKTSGANILLGDTSLDSEISEIDKALVQINTDVSGLSTTVSTQGGKISTLEQKVGTISAEVVEKADKKYSGTGFGWELTADGFVVYKIANNKQNNIFAVNNDGATLSGWALNETGIYKLSDSVGECAIGLYSMPHSIDHSIANLWGVDWVFLAGEMIDDPSGPRELYHFGVTEEGVLAAEGAYIAGTINAEGGSIGPLTILSGINLTIESLVNVGSATRTVLSLDLNVNGEKVYRQHKISAIMPRKGEKITVTGTITLPPNSTNLVMELEQGDVISEQGVQVVGSYQTGNQFTIEIYGDTPPDGGTTPLEFRYSYIAHVNGFAVGEDGSTYIAYLAVDNLKCPRFDDIFNSINSLNTSLQTDIRAINSKINIINNNFSNGVTGQIRVKADQVIESISVDSFIIDITNGLITKVQKVVDGYSSDYL